MAERISTPSKTKEIIEANRFAFKKNFGQNFLIDSNILDNIAACAGVTKEDCVLEIGPGIGSLTQVLAENAGQVVAVEIDNTLIPILKQTLEDYDNIEILNQDILKTDIDAKKDIFECSKCGSIWERDAVDREEKTVDLTQITKGTLGVPMCWISILTGLSTMTESLHPILLFSISCLLF